MTLDHIPPSIRPKVEADLAAGTEPDGFRFDVSNDYQLHLYALYLRQQGSSEQAITAELLAMSIPVPASKKAGYVDDVVHSVIVGFPNQAGELLPVYQRVT